ncbi:transcriptional regulator NrdR [Candidatus Woesearchaeota archaeon]|nr:transcriptional regulator NrdR [Candidatus Woesearchaeota archaeon]
MKCPFCQHIENSVLDSRLTADEVSIRRRRECSSCAKRFTTYERVELFDIGIIKRDGRREPFNREKILKGIMRACEKRPVKREQMDTIVDSIESALRQSDKQEIKSQKLGELVMHQLAQLDEVAYVRFASVYKKFKDASQFVDAIKILKKMEAE